MNYIKIKGSAKHGIVSIKPRNKTYEKIAN